MDLIKKKFFPKAYREQVKRQEKQAELAQKRQQAQEAKEGHEPNFQRRHQDEPPEKQTGWRGVIGRLRLPRNHPLRRFLRRYHVGKILAALVAFLVLIVSGYLFYIAKTTNVSDLQASMKSKTVIYDRSNNEAGSLSGQKGTYVELDSISQDLQNAVIATEDRTFYENKGINFSRFVLALVTMGRFGGGSTITQQLAKNAYLSQEQTIERKAKEFFLAIEINKHYSKSQILTMYLNNAYFGNGVWGVEDASKKYFGVSASQLSLDEAATLAGMLKGPGIYNPIYSTQNATNRRNTVLQNMVAAKYINQSQADEAAQVDMSSRLSDTYTTSSADYRYPSYFDAVINEAMERYGLSESEILNNGYKIYTELDQNYQSNMQATLDDTSLIPVSDYDGSMAQAASVAVDPSTGGVRGLVGRVNSDVNVTFRSFNYATQSKRSPGSSIKPLVVYSPAVSEGWSITTSLPNTKRDFNGYSPSNWANIETQDIPMYQALANSYNIPAVYTLNKIGIDKAFTYGKKFGLSMSGVSKELGVALGSGVTTNPLQMAQAYSTFANGGVMNDAHLITKIESASGEVIANHKTTSKRILSTGVTDKMTSMMLGTFSNGSAVNANVYGYTMAGKTGTVETSFNADLTSDQWVIGYTPDVVIAQWLGFENTDENHYLTDASSGTGATLFQAVASGVLPYTSGTAFTVENAYVTDGQTLTYSTDGTASSSSSDTANNQVQSIWNSITDGANKVKDSIVNSNVGQSVKNAWDSLMNSFN